MKKVLCPICGNVIRFEENDRSLTCPVCHSLIKIKIQSVDNKIIEGAEFGIPTEQLFSDDEIIIAELDKTAPALTPDDGASLKKTDKRVPPTLGVRQEKTSSPVLVYGKETRTENIAVKKQPLQETAVLDAPASTPIPSKTDLPVPDSELKWVRWEDVECESELLEDDEITGAAEVAKSKKRLRIPADYRLFYLPLYSILSLISIIVMLYSPILYISGGINIDGAKIIGAMISSTELFPGTLGLYAYLLGALILTSIVSSVCYAVYTFVNYGEYNKKTLSVSCCFALLLFSLVTACSVLAGLIFASEFVSGVVAFWSGLLLVIVIQAYVLISNFDKLPKYREEKRVLLSPKSTRRKAYFLLGVSMLFIWSLVIGALLSLGSNIAYNVLYNIDETNPLLPKFSALSLGIFGTVFNLIWTGDIYVASSAADYMLYSYIDYAVFALTMLLIIAYTRYANKTSSIFLEEIRPSGNDNVLLENEVKEQNLAKFLKKSSSPCLILYAVLMTLELAGYVVLYRGTASLIPALFTMLSSVVFAAIRCYPYAILSREQYMKAFVEYEEMGADIPPMTRKQLSRLEGYPMLLVLAGYSIFIALTVI